MLWTRVKGEGNERVSKEEGEGRERERERESAFISRTRLPPKDIRVNFLHALFSFE